MDLHVWYIDSQILIFIYLFIYFCYSRGSMCGVYWHQLLTNLWVCQWCPQVLVQNWVPSWWWWPNMYWYVFHLLIRNVMITVPKIMFFYFIPYNIPVNSHDICNRKMIESQGYLICFNQIAETGFWCSFSFVP
jgi:hypothetical protein